MANTEHDIRPVSEAPTVVNKEVNPERNSCKESPKSSKGDLVIEVKQVDEKKEVPRNAESDDKDDEAENDYGIDWRPGFKQQFLWIGFAGLMTVIIATALAVAILSQSHKKRVKD